MGRDKRFEAKRAILLHPGTVRGSVFAEGFVRQAPVVLVEV